MEALPAVTAEVAAAIKAEILRTQGNEYFLDVMKRLERDNPQLAEFLSHYALQYEERAAVAAAGLLVYRLLESQLEADHLRREFA